MQGSRVNALKIIYIYMFSNSYISLYVSKELFLWIKQFLKIYIDDLYIWCLLDIFNHVYL